MLDIKRYHPGVHLKDALDALGMRAAEFSLRTGISERSLSALLNGKNDVTFEIAQKLSSFFGDTINFWMNLQHDYDAYLSREKSRRQDEMDQRLIQEYDIRDYLISLGVANESDPQEVILQKARKFAGVSALTLLNRKDGFVSFKEEKSGGSSHPFAQNYWVASALTEARKKRHRPFDKKRLTEDQRKEKLAEFESILLEHARKQSVAVVADKPTHVFFRNLFAMADGGMVTIMEREKPKIGNSVVGYEDDAYYYFLLDKCVGEVKRFCENSNQSFTLSSKALAKQLREEGILNPIGTANTDNIKIMKRNVRVVRLLKSEVQKILSSLE